MKLGFFTQPVHPITRNYRDILREDQEAVILADELGYEDAFIGEHMTDLAEPITSCLVFIGTLIDKTKRIKLGSGVVNLPSYHPVHVAAQVAMVDHLLNGRFIFGIGPGGLPSDVEVFGNLDLDKNAYFGGRFPMQGLVGIFKSYYAIRTLWHWCPRHNANSRT